MKKLLFLIVAILSFAIESRAQSFDFGGFKSATNYSAVAYITHFEANNKIGGGVMALYNFNSYTGAGIGADWAGQWRLFNGNVNAHYSYTLSQRLSVTLYGVAVLGASSSGAGTDNGSPATGEGAGAYLSYRFSSHSAGIGGNYITRQNCGAYSGGSEAITAFFTF